MQKLCGLMFISYFCIMIKGLAYFIGMKPLDFD